MPQRIRALLVPLLLAGLLSACASIGTPPPAPAPGTGAEVIPEQSRLDGPLLYEILLGEISGQLGSARDGTSYLLDAARRTGDEGLYRRATELAIESQAGPAAREAAQAWHDAFPGSVEAARYQLQVQLALGRVSETVEPLRAMLHAMPLEEKRGLITALPAFYQRVPDPDEAARAVEEALQESLKNRELAAAVWTTIGRMRLQAGDASGALSAATLGQNADPAAEWPALLALQLLSATGNESAEALALRHLARPSAKPDVRVAYVHTLFEQERYDEARAQLDVLTSTHPDFAEGWLLKGVLDEDQRSNAEAEQALVRYLELTADPDTATTSDSMRNQALLALARIAERKGDSAAADAWLTQIPASERTLQAQVHQASLMAAQGRLDDARRLIQAIPERRQEDARLKVQAEAQLLRDHGAPQHAWAMLQDALVDAPEDEGLLYDAAMTAERMDRVDDMELLLRRLISLDPNAAHAYNALGYTLADRGLRLTEARDLIAKAAELSPDDGYIQDSLGWVEFRLGNVERARELLEAAYAQRPDPEIAAHLGEVLWTLGEHDAARSIWAAGALLDQRSDAVRNTMRRLGVTP